MKSIVTGNNEIMLSIGMIVKNEEKVLRRCLESLKPIMKEIKCELIIADTGSTDNTVEIAKEYTDNVFYFEWINDFAAARNSTLKRAKGMWYLFIDADEYFENAEQLILFFKDNNLLTKYKSIELTVRSYLSEDYKEFSEINLPRLHRINHDDSDRYVTFEGTVHETIPIRRPYGNITTILHHTGYMFSSEQQRIKKKQRNMPLMKKEFEDNPNNLRILSHIIDGNKDDKEETELYINKALDLITQKDFEDAYKRVTFMQIVNFYRNIRAEYALEICEKYYECQQDADEFVATVGISAIRASILSALARYKAAIEEFKRYFDLYEKYHSDKLKGPDSSAHSIYGTTKQDYEKYFYTAVLCYENTGEYQSAFELLNTIDVTKAEGESFRNHLATVRRVCASSKDYSYMAHCYVEVCKTGDLSKVSLALYMLESTYYSLVTHEERLGFAEDVCNSDAEGKYIELMNLVLNQNCSDFTNKLMKFINSIDCWDDGYSEAIYLAVKNKLDISNVVSKMRTELMRSKLQEIAFAHDDFADLVLEYGIPETYFESIKKFFWIVSLYEKASYRTFKLNNDEKYRLYITFVSLLGDYVMNIYNPELLNDDDIEVISTYHQFGYHMHNAMESFNTGDAMGYIRNLKKGLASCESMKEIVHLLLNNFRKENNI